MTTTKRNYVRHGGPYNKVQLHFPEDEGRTKQSFSEQCEINNIMARHQQGIAITHLNEHGPNYGFATGHDFAESLRIIKTAQDMFDGLPSSIRNRFQNDPAQFLDFVQDADNRKEGEKLGIWEETPEEPPQAPPEPEQPEPVPLEPEKD